MLSESAEVTIQIYDIRGSLVRTLHMGRKPAGVYDTKELAGYWDGRNDAGERISSGLYFYKLIAGTFTQVKRMTIIK
jgi:flagellar hook assembly protein FlgD